MRAIWLAGAAAVLPSIAFAGAAEPPVLPAPGTFAPPQTPMLLTRTFRRALPGGVELVARRQYRVTIVRSGEGFSVEGTLVDVEVQAPPMLAALAAIERSRPDPGLFPIALDAGGLIRSGNRVVPGEALHRAAGVTAAEVNKVLADPAERQQAQAFVRQVELQAAGSQWPADLFHPSPGSRRESRSVSLPGGGEGHVTIEIDARSAGAPGMVSRIERVVTTELGGTTRVTREEWTLQQPG
jgi:hypothetical protein